MDVLISLSGQSYLDAPEGHRTTFVVGALDMFAFLSLYVSAEHRDRFEKIMSFTRNETGGTLRLRLDQFIRAEEFRLTQGAANSFFVGLGKWSGVDQ
jgi:hypothetical protein